MCVCVRCSLHGHVLRILRLITSVALLAHCRAPAVSHFASPPPPTHTHTLSEIWKGEPYDHKSDVWALGCLVFELMTLRPPFTAANQYTLGKKVVEAPVPRVPSDLYSAVRLLGGPV